MKCSWKLPATLCSCQPSFTRKGCQSSACTCTQQSPRTSRALLKPPYQLANCNIEGLLHVDRPCTHAHTPTHPHFAYVARPRHASAWPQQIPPALFRVFRMSKLPHRLGLNLQPCFIVGLRCIISIIELSLVGVVGLLRRVQP